MACKSDYGTVRGFGKRVFFVEKKRRSYYAKEPISKNDICTDYRRDHGARVCVLQPLFSVCLFHTAVFHSAGSAGIVQVDFCKRY